MGAMRAAFRVSSRAAERSRGAVSPFRLGLIGSASTLCEETLTWIGVGGEDIGPSPTVAGADIIGEPSQSHCVAIDARAPLYDGGIVTRVKKDHVMAQVEMVCGSHRMVSLMSADAADELGLEPGVRAVASVKSTNVVVEVP